MRFKSRLNLLPFLLSVFILFSCEKESAAPVEPDLHAKPIVPACQLQGDSSYGGAVMNKYFYDSQNRLFRIYRRHFSTGEHNEYLTYNAAGKIIRNDFYSLDSTMFRSDAFLYNSKAQLSRLVPLEIPHTGVDPALNKVYTELVYHNNQVTEKNYYNLNNSPVPYRTCSYKYLPNGVIEERDNASWRTFTPVMEYRYDTYKNEFKIISQLYLHSPIADYNVVSIKTFSDTLKTAFIEHKIAYQYNTQGFPVSYTETDWMNEQRTFYNFFTCK